MVDKEEYLITTVDNPYNPHRQWDDWYAYDVAQGYDTLAILARMTFDVLDYDNGDMDRAQAHMVLSDPEEKYLLVTDRNFDALITANIK